MFSSLHVTVQFHGPVKDLKVVKLYNNTRQLPPLLPNWLIKCDWNLFAHVKAA